MGLLLVESGNIIVLIRFFNFCEPKLLSVDNNFHKVIIIYHYHYHYCYRYRYYYYYCYYGVDDDDDDDATPQ